MDVRARARVALLVTAAYASLSVAHAEGFYFGLNAGGSDYDVRSSDVARPVYSSVFAGGFTFNPYSVAPPVAAAPSYSPRPPLTAWVTGAVPNATPCSPFPICTGPVFQPLVPVSESLDTSATALKVDVGYRFNSYFAAELSYADLGTVTYEAQYNLPGPGTTSFPLRQSSDVEVDGIGVSLLGSYPFAQRWSLFLRGGYFFGDGQTTTRMNNFGVPSPSYSADNAFASSGVDYSFGERWGVRLEYQRFFDTGGQALRNEADVDTWSLGLQYRL